MKQTSLSERAYEVIRQQIVSLQLPPGVVIDEAELQEQLALGRTPIREALKRLALEKLVVILPRRGMFVSDIGITDLQRLFELRLILESAAAEFAAQRGTAAHWRRMEAALSALETGGDGVDNAAMIAVDEHCHQIIYDAADNEFLQDTLTTLYALSLRLWYFFLSGLGHMEDAVREHRRILNALRAGDGALAARLMTQHIQAFQDEIQAVMLGNPAP